MTDTAPYRTRIETKLRAALDPVSLTIVDDSRKHAHHGPRMAALAEQGADHGHAPIDGQGETHFRVDVVSAAFAGQSRIDRHRMVNDLLTDELRERVHALAIKARTPEEAGLTTA
ncbi:BolA family transcriptional regulator [Roseospira marina]|uniref:BolA family transcriptional regulator n=1 Tax=Roseospira marina TaxID=140057 RepID=A0A5M6I9V7_9PROT|nr:BolA family protein [Roseospira marina]KAA5604515.1 BolA family transcriptional regulator [Roseospira marina]MBB4315572.1 BolA protein [Roseospira marina]MBB5088491.1 BolA protein [Roseospira marina]